MSGIMDIHQLPLRTAVEHYLVALRVEGFTPTTVAIYRSVLGSYGRFGTAETEPTLLHVRGYVAHVISEHVRFSHHRNAPSGGRLSDHTINLHRRVL